MPPGYQPHPPVPHRRPERPFRSPKAANPLRERNDRPSARLPHVLDLLADVAVVDLPRSLHDLGGEQRHLGRGDVVLDLGGALSAWDGAGDGGVHEDPTYGDLCEGISFW